jgi:NTP pyrophosphatase (non-canonical NTP hydrolase)
MHNQEIKPSQEREIFETIKLLQMRVFGEDWGDNTNEVIQEYTKLLQVEIVEMLQETNYRTHKEEKQINYAALKEEIVDVLIYALATASTVFTNYEEFLLILRKKVEKNKTRSDWKINQ